MLDRFEEVCAFVALRISACVCICAYVCVCALRSKYGLVKTAHFQSTYDDRNLS